MKKFSSALVLFACLLFALPALADQIVGVANNGGNYYPFGGYSGEYQQVYNASAFSGPIVITALQFFDTIDPPLGPFPSGNWTISLSTTSADWNTLSTNFAANIGADNTTVFNGNLFQPSWALGNTLTINLTSPFTYIPVAGSNLLMDVNVSGTAANGIVGPDSVGSIYFDSTANSLVTGHVDFDGVNSGPATFGTGLVTGFVGSAPAVPEPSSIILLSTGLAALFLRKRPTTGPQDT